MHHAFEDQRQRHPNYGINKSNDTDYYLSVTLDKIVKLYQGKKLLMLFDSGSRELEELRTHFGVVQQLP